MSPYKNRVLGGKKAVKFNFLFSILLELVLAFCDLIF